MLRRDPTAIDEQTVELIAARVTESLREDLHAMLTTLDRPGGQDPNITVEDVALRLGVARSTVYAHWREWGGFKLGHGAKAPIRFDPARLPTGGRTAGQDAPREPPAAPARRCRRRARRALITDAPRFASPLDEVA
jgi:transposase-like protein